MDVNRGTTVTIDYHAPGEFVCLFETATSFDDTDLTQHYGWRLHVILSNSLAVIYLYRPRSPGRDGRGE